MRKNKGKKSINGSGSSRMDISQFIKAYGKGNVTLIDGKLYYGVEHEKK